jgi:DNA-binding beta-propeller fold protein YncE
MKKILFTAASLLIVMLCFAQQQGDYKIANKIHLDGDKGWDYIAVDEAANRLYVSHGDMVQVVDLANENKVAGVISGLNGVHGIAIASELNKGFISSGKDSNVVVFDLNTLAVLAKVKVTGNHLIYDVWDFDSDKVATNGAIYKGIL